MLYDFVKIININNTSFNFIKKIFEFLKLSNHDNVIFNFFEINVDIIDVIFHFHACFFEFINEKNFVFVYD